MTIQNMFGTMIENMFLTIQNLKIDGNHLLLVFMEYI